MRYIPKNRLDGKVAIITGSTDGIGYAIARRLAQEGAQVIVSSRKQTNVDSAVSKLCSEGLKIKGLVCHVCNAEERKKLFDEANKLGGLDILISNAAVNPITGDVLSCTETEWDKIFDVNVKAAFLLVKEGASLIKKKGGGSIVFISSLIGLRPHNLLGAYSVSKTALLGLTKSAAMALANANITVNCIAPGPIKTKFIKFITEIEHNLNYLLSHIPMNKIGEPEDISGLVSFLVSDDARYITGEVIVAAGGATSRL